MLQRKASDTGSGRTGSGWILATHPRSDLRNGTEAVDLGKRLCELTGGTNAVALGTLAAAYAEAGQFTEAIAAAQTARERAAQAGQSGVVAMLLKHLQFYQSNQPWREQR